MVSTQQAPPPEPIRSTPCPPSRAPARWPSVAAAFVLGGFAALLLGQLGIFNALGFSREDPMFVVRFARCSPGLLFL